MPIDLNTLAQIDGPAAAALMAGQQEGLSQTQQANQNAIESNPGYIAAKQQAPALANMFSQAQTQNEQGLAANNQAQGQVAQALVPGNISAGQAEAGAKTSTANLQSLATAGQMAGQLAGMLDGVPAPARPAAMAQIGQQYGFDPSKFGPGIASGDPASLRAFSQSAVQATQQFQQAATVQGLKNTGAANVATINAGARTGAATITAQARTDAATITGQYRAGQLSIDQTIAKLSNNITAVKAQGGTPPQDLVDQLSGLVKIKQATANNLPSQLVGGDTVTTPQQNAQAGINQITGQSSTPPASPGGLSPDDVAKAQLGNAYDSSKEYRIGPNGQLQARPK